MNKFNEFKSKFAIFFNYLLYFLSEFDSNVLVFAGTDIIQKMQRNAQIYTIIFKNVLMDGWGLTSVFL